MIDLLSPVGDFECLKAAVQNGANSVYFGANIFNARAFASNFTLDELKKCISYAKLRGVKTNLALNILLKDNELSDAINVAKFAYEFGIDAIIVQDLGLGKYLINNFPGLAVHGSTQMTTHNLDGVLLLQKLGFSRVVLARELPIAEIEYICKNSNIEIETFIHGALCISYSGQCLFSSLVGGRSGNRGKCAGPCRLPYILKTTNGNAINSGYLLSPRDLCGLDFIPNLLKAGVTCLKIEGRMKSPEYVATVTRIYRKYINLAKSASKYFIEESDKKELLQVFNRGNFSTGHLSNKANEKLIFKEKPNNIGLPLGKIMSYQKNKGLITTNLKETLSIGDKITIDKTDGTYTVSELMENGKNIKKSIKGKTITIGRMKGNIHIGANLYKIGSKALFESSKKTYSQENIKIDIICDLKLQINKPIIADVYIPQFSITKKFIFDIYPQKANTQCITNKKIEEQFSKTSDTPFYFKKLNINMQNNIFLPISNINQIRREILKQTEQNITDSFKRNLTKNQNFSKPTISDCAHNILPPKISLFLQQIKTDIDYTKLKNIDRLYIPLIYFMDTKYINILKILSQKFSLFIYLPNIIRENLIQEVKNSFLDILKKFSIKGVVISSISCLEFINSLPISKKLEKIGNYTLSCLNSLSIDILKKSDIDCLTLSPELDKDSLSNLCELSNLPTELIVYGRLPIMTCNYCFLGQTNKCIPSCNRYCNKNGEYYLQDRKKLNFPIYASPMQTTTIIYNSKITSINPNTIPTSSVRIDILDENIDEINSIIGLVRSGKRKEGKVYTSNNLNREI